jgi:hypothetical protein
LGGFAGGRTAGFAGGRTAGFAGGRTAFPRAHAGDHVAASNVPGGRANGEASSRVSLERNVFRVRARVTLIRPEEDGDLHLVLEDTGGRHMIAESPSDSCTAGATAYRRKQMKTARKAILDSEKTVMFCPNATVAGVAFFDFDHGQTGVAPNAIELHPVLRFACTST